MQARSHLMESPRESPLPGMSGHATADGHANALLIRRLYASLQARDHVEAAKCYADDASFEDIAFRPRKRDVADAIGKGDGKRQPPEHGGVEWG